MNESKNPNFGQWNVNWEDDRETAESLGTSFRRERHVSGDSDWSQETGMHIEDWYFSDFE